MVKCSGVALSDEPQVVSDAYADYSGRVSGTVDLSGKLLGVRFCDGRSEGGRCLCDGMNCPLPLVRR